ncbi:N-acetylneuraminate synthase [Paradesulfitobacterium aromaticivorans]
MFRIGGKNVGAEYPCLVIAEVGSNHEGDLEKAKTLIMGAARAGADVVKFQSLSADELISTKRMVNGKWEKNPAYQAVKKLETPKEWYPELIAKCQDEGVLFLSTPFSSETAFFLNDLGIPGFKIASGDLTHIPLIREVAELKKPMIISTGAATIDEIKLAIRACESADNDQLVILHCVSCYPAMIQDANIRALKELEQFGYPVGFSDHTLGFTVTLGAVALGANVIEKHITFDRSLPGSDHGHSLTIDEFAAMVNEIRSLESALGNGQKVPVKDEIPERVGARRSIYARIPLPAGTRLEKSMIKIVRHAYGIPPYELDNILGRQTKHDMQADEALQWGDLC